MVGQYVYNFVVLWICSFYGCRRLAAVCDFYTPCACHYLFILVVLYSCFRHISTSPNWTVESSYWSLTEVDAFEPHHDKTNKMACALSEDSYQPGHPLSLIRVFAVRMKKPWALSYILTAQRSLIRLGGCPGWSEPSLGAQVSLFCHVAAHFFFVSLLFWVRLVYNTRPNSQGHQSESFNFTSYFLEQMKQISKPLSILWESDILFH